VIIALQHNNSRRKILATAIIKAGYLLYFYQFVIKYKPVGYRMDLPN